MAKVRDAATVNAEVEAIMDECMTVDRLPGLEDLVEDGPICLDTGIRFLPSLGLVERDCYAEE
jgi:hypothetical protein